MVDPLSFPALKQIGCPVTFDVTHALQLPGAQGSAAGGRAEHAEALALAGVSQGLAGLFLEVHPDPARALCDGPSALATHGLSRFLGAGQALDRLVKSGFPAESAAGLTVERDREEGAPMHRVFIGYDSKQDIAYHVLRYSILKHASQPIDIRPIVLSELEFPRPARSAGLDGVHLHAVPGPVPLRVLRPRAVHGLRHVVPG